MVASLRALDAVHVGVPDNGFHHLLMVASLRAGSAYAAHPGQERFHHLLMVASLRAPPTSWSVEDVPIVSTIF